jgi:putative ABC transport system ATP-binding protein
MNAALITFDRVTKTYGGGSAQVRALDCVSFGVRSGEFVAIMGPSGSGKSTAMSILGCLDIPTSGRYFFKGVDVATLTRDQRTMLRRHFLGFVFQDFNLIARTTALENLELPLVYQRVGQSERRAMAVEVLEAVGLSGHGHRLPSELSGGQQQRVALARALVARPSLLLADEPTGNLDSNLGRDIMHLLTRLNREQNLTIVLVTHDREIAGYAHRQLEFRDGRVVRESGSAIM